MALNMDKQYVVLDASTENLTALLAWASRQGRFLVGVDVVCRAALSAHLRGLGLTVLPVGWAAPLEGRMLFAVLLRHPLEPVGWLDQVVATEAARHLSPVAATLATADHLVSRVRVIPSKNSQRAA